MMEALDTKFDSVLAQMTEMKEVLDHVDEATGHAVRQVGHIHEVTVASFRSKTQKDKHSMMYAERLLPVLNQEPALLHVSAVRTASSTCVDSQEHRN